jgi:hypothetical protein
MSPYSRRQAIVAAAGFTAFAALGAQAQHSNVQRSAIMDKRVSRLVHRIGPSGSSIPGAGSGEGERQPGNLRTGSPDGVAHTPAWADVGRHGRSRMGAARGRFNRGDSCGRRRVVSGGPEALARRIAHDSHDAYRHSRIGRRQERRLDGESKRRAISEVRCAMGGWETVGFALNSPQWRVRASRRTGGGISGAAAVSQSTATRRGDASFSSSGTRSNRWRRRDSSSSISEV